MANFINENASSKSILIPSLDILEIIKEKNKSLTMNAIILLSPTLISSVFFFEK